MNEQEWTDRFFREIGKLFFNSPSASLSARIKNPLDMIRDYFDVPDLDGSPEVAAKHFVKEFSLAVAPFVSGREEMLKSLAQRWTGSNDPAAAAYRRLSEELSQRVAEITASASTR